ncbi:MAG: metalloregulator ArsR/SmtB family transcription factor [Phycisphaerales bacterium]|nr:metalloregulator ArsR/SmtB family transcription factor [Phycisphaerales bacterium]
MPREPANPRDRWLGWLGTLGDLARVRMLRLLAREELGVGELARALQLPQSTVSRHLKPLFDDGWVSKRAEGTQSLYRLRGDDLEPGMRSLWQMGQEHLGPRHAFEEDDARLAEVLAARRVDSRTFFGRVAGDWDALRHELFGTAFVDEALLGLLPPDAVAIDFGCGTGEVAERLAAVVRRVIAVDREPAMVAAARKRLAHLANVEVREGDLLSPPLAAAEADFGVVMLVFHHADDPGAMLRAIAPALRPGGALLVVDMVRHDRAGYQQSMGHRHLGFSEEDLARHAQGSGLALRRFVRLRPDMAARGPGLFAALLVR